jgi:ATP-binding protein involved in chromosome partitioning
VLLVTTPQPLAQEVALRAALMAQRTGMRVLGVVENMAGEAFGTGGGELLARRLEVDYLGSVPLDVELRESGDRGEPVVESRPGSPSAQAILALAELVAIPKPGRVQRPLTVLS